MSVLHRLIRLTRLIRLLSLIHLITLIYLIRTIFLIFLIHLIPLICLRQTICVRYSSSAIRRLSLDDRISMFNDLLSYNPGNWILDDVLQIGIKQGEYIGEMFEGVEDEEDLREELDENLEGITDAVLTGQRIRSEMQEERLLLQIRQTLLR
jgi:hypothetical protein